jgi:hypothetical protein
MLERGGTNEISIRAGTVCAVEGIAWHVREEILSGCVDGILPAAAAAAARGDNVTVGRSRDKDYRHCLRAIVDKVLAVTIYWYLSSSNVKLGL